ncbi:UNVERIFIED_CONTAM: hypothetical protein Sradi_3281700 [Sesamum radiatum]|uniref:Uncharacterized protein n=1 Tax=Sesamum radiatum TaxID=300843 RepID=A0AAW2R114_SESRA
MADGTRMKDLQDAQRKQEALLIEERAERKPNEHHFTNQLENVLAMQASMQNSMEEFQRTMHMQMQSMVEQMQSYNRNKSVLGEGLTANTDMASSSRIVQPPQSGKGILKMTPRIVGAKDHILRTQNSLSFPDSMVKNQGSGLEGVTGLMEMKEVANWNDFVEAILERCKQVQHIMTMSEEEEQEYMRELGEELVEGDEDEPSEDVSVSVNAMNGNVNMNTFKINGKAYGRDIQVLIDGGSTNCFLDEDTAYELRCKLEYTTAMQVSVANGKKIVSDMYCPEFTWKMQDQKFNYPLRVIKLGGCDVVLGGDWLRKHGPVEYDYEGMKVTVATNGKRLILKALTKATSHHAELQMISAKSMKRLILGGNYKLMGQLSAVNSRGEN